MAEQSYKIERPQAQQAINDLTPLIQTAIKLISDLKATELNPAWFSKTGESPAQATRAMQEQVIQATQVLLMAMQRKQQALQAALSTGYVKLDQTTYDQYVALSNGGSAPGPANDRPTT